MVAQSVVSDGWAALANGGGLSWVVWLALAAAVRLALTAAGAASRLDLLFAGGCLLAIALPAHFVINLAATALALRYAFAPGMPAPLRGAGVILFTLFFSIFWSIHIFPMFAGPLAVIDAWWVGLVSGAEIDGNIVSFKEGEGSFLLAGPCTSVANASLALLLWISISRSFRPQGSRGQWLVAVGVFASAVAVNVIRLAMMSQNLTLFDLVHASEWVTLAVTATGLGWGIWDARREIFA